MAKMSRSELLMAFGVMRCLLGLVGGHANATGQQGEIKGRFLNKTVGGVGSRIGQSFQLYSRR